jgi:choice-of-anchor B domain-containing protein
MARVGALNPTTEDYNDIWGLEMGGSDYAILGSVNYIYVIDVTDCTNPVVVAQLDPPGNSSIWRDFKTSNGYIYGVCENCVEGLVIIDANGLPGSTLSIDYQTTAFFDRAHNIFIDGDYLYAVGTESAIEGVVILDISSPLAPTLVANIDFDVLINGVNTSANYYIHDINVSNGIAYASHGNLGEFIAWDISDPNNITMEGSYFTGNYTHSSWNTPDGEYAYVAEEVPNGLPLRVIDMLDVSGNFNMTQVGTFSHSIDPGNSTPHNPFVKGDTLFVSNYQDGIKLYDISTPDVPSLLGYYDTYAPIGYNGYQGAWGVYPYLSSGCILGSDISSGLSVLKFTGAVVDLEWGLFNVDYKGKNSALLQWSTLSESNTSDFNILRSSNGIDYQPIGNIAAQGNSSTLSSYQFTDSDLLSGISYYKIRQNDRDGSFSYSEVKSIQIISDRESLKIAPTVISGNGLRLMNIDASRKYNFRVISSDGKTIAHRFTTNTGELHITFENPLTPGIYSLQIMENGNYISTQKFMAK